MANDTQARCKLYHLCLVAVDRLLDSCQLSPDMDLIDKARALIAETLEEK